MFMLCCMVCCSWHGQQALTTSCALGRAQGMLLLLLAAFDCTQLCGMPGCCK
jgi:hypothetical protein